MPPAHRPPSDARPLTRETAPGRRVLVLANYWPQYACTEHAGAGWEADVVSATGVSAVVRFTYARAQDGRQWEPERVPYAHVRPL